MRNAGFRYNVEVADFTRSNSLPIFSLIFTEFESKGFLSTPHGSGKVDPRGNVLPAYVLSNTRDA